MVCGLDFTLRSNCFAKIPLLSLTLYLCSVIFFQGSTSPDFIENIYFLNSHSFQASSHQYLQIKYILFIFFKVLLNDDCHFAFSSKIFLWGASSVRVFRSTSQLCYLIFNVWMQFGASSFVFLCLAMSVNNVWSWFVAHWQDV